MPIVSFPYKPEHLAFCDKPVWVSATEGDTPTLQFPIRMLGIDAPELHYQGATATTPGKYDAPFNTFLTAAGRTSMLDSNSISPRSYSITPVLGTSRLGKPHSKTSRLWLKNTLHEKARTANRSHPSICS